MRQRLKLSAAAPHEKTTRLAGRRGEILARDSGVTDEDALSARDLKESVRRGIGEYGVPVAGQGAATQLRQRQVDLRGDDAAARALDRRHLQILPITEDTCVLAEPASRSGELAAKTEEPAPNFILLTLTGEPIDTADYRGKTLVLNFWTSWCPPCRAEIPDL